MPRVHLFIDTNILLNFYHFADDSLEQLEQLIDKISDVGICLHLPQHVINEFTRNRETKLKAANDQFLNQSFSAAVPRHMQQYSQREEYLTAIEQVKTLRTRLVALVSADASNKTLAPDVLINNIFAKASKYPEDQDVFEAALQRMQKGNPPGKNGSVGDQYNWETLLNEVPNGDLHIVSKDGDYASLFNKSRPHPSLELEWMRTKIGHLHIYQELRAFLRKYSELLEQEIIQQVSLQPTQEAILPNVELPSVLTQQHVEPNVEVALPPTPENVDDIVHDTEKEEAMQMLIQSGSFATTHEAVARLSQLRSMLHQPDVERLIRAVVDNAQIRWIATDSDVYAFFTSLLTEHSNIDPNLFEEAIDVFDLRPEPNDPFDD